MIFFVSLFKDLYMYTVKYVIFLNKHYYLQYDTYIGNLKVEDDKVHDK